ncbi:MAG: 2-amino-4-hydroxy-6-hydroxymethyldihydropteridine diphosphokinase [Gammaproteobacteria bacterium]|nr:2-amino-4-hydroxy-6-hydroxymethyldihydropteridine diphosphokinase [Gammaproteobacteria bacterium]
MSVRVFLGLGSNLDNPLKQLKRAVSALREHSQIEFIRVSSAYLTKPMGPEDQADYYNAVVELSTALSAEALLVVTQSIEQQQGRKYNGKRWHERIIDLDILLYGDERIDSDNLIVPHPGLHERGFVLFPLYELDKNINIPGKGSIDQFMQSELTGEVLRKLDTVL